MPLSDLQIALGMMVTTQAAPHRTADPSNFDNLRLTAAERGWLAQLPDTPGFNVTCYIQRWWRETKLHWTTRLTLAALGTGRADAALKAYLEATPCPSLFFTPEALGFLDFVAGMAMWTERADGPHVLEIARFERALLIAKEAAQQSVDRQSGENEFPSGARLAPHPAAALLEFAAPPAELLGALVEGRSLPPVSSMRFPVLVAPGLAYLWRPASADESRLFTRCQTAPSVEDLLASIPDPAPSLHRLLSAGALQSIV
ncbi:MAG: lipid A deacylase LpxR family protein [Acidobacteria bacterium]|nr:lipid A deacylase LpxR family protein [Acidobacteriota bacterium]